METQRAAEQLLGGAGNATWDRVNLLPPVFLDIVLAASSAAPAPVLSGLDGSVTRCAAFLAGAANSHCNYFLYPFAPSWPQNPLPCEWASGLRVISPLAYLPSPPSLKFRGIQQALLSLVALLRTHRPQRDRVPASIVSVVFGHALPGCL